MEEHEKTKKAIEEKLKQFESQGSTNENDQKEYKRLKLVQELMNDQYRSFFSEINMDLALKILMDLGKNKEEAIESYQKLMKETVKNKYRIIGNDEIEIRGEK